MPRCFLVAILALASSLAFADEYDDLRLKWKDLTTGTGYNPEDPDVASKLTSIANAANNYGSSLDTSMNPNVSDTLPCSWQRSGATFEFIYTRSNAATDLTFVVEWSDTLGNDWSSAGVTQSMIPDSDNGITQQWKAIIPAAPTRPFTHLKVTRP